MAASHLPTASIAKTAAAAAALTTAAAAPPVSTAAFAPRAAFDVSPSITRSYFLGHHRAALANMQRTLSTVGLVIECRDFRVPLTSWNPLLERAVSGPERARVVAYTKRDLAPAGGDVEAALLRWHRRRGDADEVVFLGGKGKGSGGGGGGGTPEALLAAVKRVARGAENLTGLRALVVGMPNAGKSTLLNRLRTRGMGRDVAKAARTGAQPGVTRKLGTPVRIVEPEGVGEGVFVVDTPGVFVPYVSDAESMLKLALVGCVKDGLVGSVTVADYLLFQLNRRVVPYGSYCAVQTNDVHEFLTEVARRTGKLLKGGVPAIDAAADWVVQEWRRGRLGRFVLDDVDEAGIEEAERRVRQPALSMNQARKKEKEVRKVRNEAKRLGVATTTSTS